MFLDPQLQKWPFESGFLRIYGQHYFNGHLITFVEKLFQDWDLGWGPVVFLTKLTVILVVFFSCFYSVSKRMDAQ